MTKNSISAWSFVHKWSSLISTLFLLMLCVTGLPLVFHDEIAALAADDNGDVHAGPPSAAHGLPLDRIVATAISDAGGGVPLFIGFSQHKPVITVTVGPTAGAAEDEMRLFSYNRMSGKSIGEIREDGVMHFILHLHKDMFLGLPGMLLLGAMGALFVIAIVSGVVLYAPFMRRLRFGTLRDGQNRRARVLDRHNLLGIVTLGWLLVVGLTGVINTLADPLTDQWREGELASMVNAQMGAAALSPKQYGSIDLAMQAAKSARPGLSPQFIGFPGGAWSSARHYAIFFRGDTPLTSHALTPALVDAETAKLNDIRSMPALNQALMLSKPLHFGDYGGLPMKILWAVLDLGAIWLLISGLQLWRGSGAERRMGRQALA
jgi:uncharacterized iron-regulated membrane protein